MRRIVAVLTLALVSCGGSDGGVASWKVTGQRCAAPRTGADPVTGQAYRDAKGTLEDEKSWLRAWIDDTYLWYSEVPNVNASAYTSATSYFDALRTPAITSSGNPKDRFHFYEDTVAWEQLSQSGVSAGYGVTWAIVAPAPPRKVLVAYTEPNSPATANNLARGAEVLTIDNVDVVNGSDVNTLNNGLFPTASGQPHSFTVRDLGAATTRTFSMTSGDVTGSPVQNVQTITLTPTDKVGYMTFNDHLAPAEKQLIDAINKFKTDNITDLVIDLRYNGGGYLVIASELAYMIAGPAKTSGKFFERLTFNDKHASVDPVTGGGISPTAYQTTSVGLSAPSGGALPTLGLNRVFVLTGSGTCSASESVLNGLAGADVQVIQIGSTTCGKPYGFYPQDNCGTTYFSIQFKGVNAKGFGDYADGFVPGATTAGSFVGCKVADDFGHQLGDVNEARMAAALAYRTSTTCPAPTSSALVEAGLMGEGRVYKSIFQENRIYRR